MSADFILISDVDDTMLGDDQALQRFTEARASFSAEVHIAYASGRFCDSIYEDVRARGLPSPVAVIGGVGSEIRHYPSGELDEDWVRRSLQQWSAEQVRRLLADEQDLQLQPESAQSEFKISYFLHNASQGRLEELQAKLRQAGIKADYVYSSSRDLDFLPAGVNKGAAAAFLVEQLGFKANRVFVAGNSGNDSKLFEYGFWGIIVANAHDELKQYAENEGVYLSRHGFAEGVRDGIEHWLSKLIFSQRQN